MQITYADMAMVARHLVDTQICETVDAAWKLMGKMPNEAIVRQAEVGRGIPISGPQFVGRDECGETDHGTTEVAGRSLSVVM